MHRLGERIKKRRNFMQISLGELATQIGVSSSLLSQIENGKAYPSIFTLKSIAECLTTTVGELIGENEFGQENPLVQWDDKKFYRENESGCKVYSLSDYTSNRQMEVFLVTMDGGSTSHETLDSHHGQEIWHVLQGEVHLKTVNGNIILKKGDTYYNQSCEDREIHNEAKGEARVLWTLTPPLQ